MKKCTSYEEQKGRRYIWENVYFGIIIFSCLLSTKPCLRFLLNCFVPEIKVFYQSSLGNEVDFRDIMNVFPNILVKNQNFKKFRHSFVDEAPWRSGVVVTTTAQPYSTKPSSAPFQILLAAFQRFAIVMVRISDNGLSWK